jgi:hypothetical protein
MSFRPTIAVYFNGKIADIGYYRNWDEMDLMAEAMGLAAAARECGTVEEYRDKVFGCQTVYYSISPERWENTPRNLKRLEECSEMPIVVDMTARAVYVSYGALSKRRIRKLPEARGWEDFAGEKCKVTLTGEVLDRMEKLIREDSEVRNRLSGDTLRVLGMEHPQP